MSDVLTKALSAAATAFLAVVNAPAGAGQAGATKPTAGATGGDDAAKKAAAAKAAAEAKAKADAAAKAKADAAAKVAAAAKSATAAGPAAGTKAPGGKHTIDEVREAIRKVATTASLGKQSATDILADDGGGVTKVTDLKPEFYDAVFDACQALLNNEGGEAGEAAPEDDLM